MPTPNKQDLWFTTARLSILQSNRQQRHAPSVIEHRMAHGFAPPRHVHRDEDETFYILEGTFRFEVGGSTRELTPGETLFIPHGVVHGFKVTSPEGGRCLTITNGGFEAMVLGASRPATASGLPEQVEPTPEMQAQLAEASHANGIDLVGPPLQ